MDASSSADRAYWRQLLFGPEPQRTLARVLVWSVSALIFFQHLLLPIKIVGSSMLPTYQHGSVNFINRLAYTRHPPKRHDVVAIRWGNELLLKRIIGLPGERVAIQRGEIIVNGNQLTDRFAVDKVPARPLATTLGPNEYFVIGDNRQTSLFAKIRKDEIVGKIVF